MEIKFEKLGGFENALVIVVIHSSLAVPSDILLRFRIAPFVYGLHIKHQYLEGHLRYY